MENSFTLIAFSNDKMKIKIWLLLRGSEKKITEHGNFVVYWQMSRVLIKEASNVSTATQVSRRKKMFKKYIFYISVK